jgi:hypothetical protein
MASTTEDMLLEEFEAIAPAAEAEAESGGGGSTGSIAETVLESGSGLFGGDSEAAPLEKYAMPRLDTGDAETVEAPSGEAVAASGVAGGVSERTESPRAQTSGDGGSSIGSIAETVLESGFGLVPLVGELFGLFGGDSETATLEKYAMPTPIAFESEVTGSGFSAGDFDQMGMPRLDAGDAETVAAASGGAATASGGTTNVAGPQITVNVQAMDAQSLMDRSSDIAQAVRAAMLNLNSINDVVNDL